MLQEDPNNPMGGGMGGDVPAPAAPAEGGMGGGMGGDVPAPAAPAEGGMGTDMGHGEEGHEHDDSGMGGGMPQ